MRRIVVVGTSGSGKSTLAKQIARAWNLPCVALDELYWGPNWTPHSDFAQRVKSVVRSEAWVIDGNYRRVRPMIWAAADAIIWLDYPMRTVLTRLFRRTVGRWWRRDVLWEGNRERLWNHFCTLDSVFVWSIETWRMHRRDYPGRLREQRAVGKTVIRLRSPQEAERWIDSIRSAASL